MVVCDVVPSEIAGWADVVLPESVYLERHDELHVEPFKQMFVGIRLPVVDAPADQKPNWWIAKTLAEKLGLSAYYPWKDIEEYLATRVKARRPGLGRAQARRRDPRAEIAHLL